MGTTKSSSAPAPADEDAGTPSTALAPVPATVPVPATAAAAPAPAPADAPVGAEAGTDRTVAPDDTAPAGGDPTGTAPIGTDPIGRDPSDEHDDDYSDTRTFAPILAAPALAVAALALAVVALLGEGLTTSIGTLTVFADPTDATGGIRAEAVVGLGAGVIALSLGLTALLRATGEDARIARALAGGAVVVSLLVLVQSLTVLILALRVGNAITGAS